MQINYNISEKTSQGILENIQKHKEYQMNQRYSLIKCIEKYNTNLKKSTINGILNCGDTIFLKNNHIIAANFCGQRLCPMCQWIKSRKVFGEIAKIYNVIKDDYKFIFVTFTIKNTNNLKSGIDTITNGYKRMLDNRTLKKIIKGSIRTIEITFNSQNKEWHPHLHCLYIVDCDYYSNNDKYITTEKWSNLWKKACRLEYNPVCYAESANGINAVSEVAKYVSKPFNIQNSGYAFYDLYMNLRKRRLREYTGIMRTYRKQIENIQINENTDEEYRDTEYYYFFNGNYKKCQNTSDIDKLKYYYDPEQ